jgi:hypothetical protein
MSGNAWQPNSISGNTPFYSTSPPLKSWEKASYNGWGAFSIKVGGVDISEKRYFETYITPLLEGSTQEPPECQQYGKFVYEKHISPAIGGGSLAPHISAYLARIEEIKKQGGYQGKIPIVQDYDKNDLLRAAEKMKLHTAENADGTTGFSAGEAASRVFTIEDKVVIDGVRLDVNQARAIKNLLEWYK